MVDTFLHVLYGSRDLWSLFYKVPNTTHEGTPHDLITSQRPLHLIPSWGGAFQCENLGHTNTQPKVETLCNLAHSTSLVSFPEALFFWGGGTYRSS